MGIVSWHDEEVSVDGGEKSGIRHGPCRALAPVDGVGEQGMVGDGRRPGAAGRPLRRIPPVVRRCARDAGGVIGAVPEPVAGNPGVNNLWRRWFELSADSWRKSAEMGQNAMEVLPRWMQMLDEARTNLLAGGAPPRDPLQLATQWYNATSGPFSDFVGDVIEREEFLEPSSRFLQSYASFYKVFKRDSEEYLKNLQLPVRSDISRIAGLVVNLEEKVDRIEEVLEDFEYGYAEPATTESVKRLETRLDRVEGKLDRLLAALE